MTIRMITSTTTVAAPDPYATAVTFTQGQVLDIPPGSWWDTQLGVNAPALAGAALVNNQTGSAPAATGNA